MDSLTINGRIVEGCGLFRRQIELPVNLLSGQEDWMESFVQGTLNIQFSSIELPAEFQARGLRSLDLNASFPPAIYRSGTDVPNNTIKPNHENPRKGDLQLWRAVLENHQTKTEHKCYLIRRVESGYRDRAEILGQHDFRREVGFLSNHAVSLTVYGGVCQT